MTDVVDLELSRHLSRTGGLGLAEKLAETLQRQYAMPEAASPTVEPPAAAFSPTAPAPPAPRPVAEPVKVAPAGALPLPLDAPVTSRFGWRTDPFDGTRRFHRGVDIGAAYGTEVPSAAPGRVEFVGEQGGYGSTVVIAHDDGLRSRYAHLSATSVEVGDRVQSGDVVGRVGRSGRATGAHLHFEIADGRTDLNPIALAKRHAALKVLQPQVDSSIDRAHALSVGTGETMKIDSRPTNLESAAAERLDRHRSGGTTSHAQPAKPEADTVRVSTDAALTSSALRAAQTAPDVRSDLVARMRERLEAGEIGNDPHRLAERLIDHLLEP